MVSRSSADLFICIATQIVKSLFLLLHQPNITTFKSFRALQTGLAVVRPGRKPRIQVYWRCKMKLKFFPILIDADVFSSHREYRLIVKPFFVCAKTNAQITSAVTAQLICIFIFARHLLPNSEVSNLWSYSAILLVFYGSKHQFSLTLCVPNYNKTRTVRGSDYSPAIKLSEQKDKLVTATGDTEKYSEKQANKVWLNSVYWFSRY